MITWHEAVSNNYKQLVKEGGGVCLNCGTKVKASELQDLNGDALHGLCFVDAVVTYENRELLNLANEYLLTQHKDLDLDNLPESPLVTLEKLSIFTV